MADGFHVRRALEGTLARLLPVADGLLGAACRRVMLGHQLWLGLNEGGEPGFEDLRNLLVDLLPGALEQ